ncbi:serine/threonine-protein kinase VRK3 isoform 2-T2 [Leptodactylus fuscus]|uniref:serine/threonine-protein kinase VRK3 isoform X2 n=1 Tax=Leptodactylus fuscus TaxID=238119 RepID=UPI003F4F3E77
MIIHFCPRCGKKAEDEFNYCPYCGIKFPKEAIESVTGTDSEHSQPADNRRQKRKNSTRLPSPALKRTLICSPQKVEEVKKVSSPAKSELKGEMSPRNKKAKNVQVPPLPENDVLTGNNGTKWVLDKFLAQEKTAFYYKVYTQSKSDKREHSILKLDSKDGKIYNEQNFFQRAAKKTTVDNWKKRHGCPTLGIPTCIGFGIHDCYRFLVFSALGQNLQTIISERNGQLCETAVYQILYRMIDVLEYIHENEYAHGDITTENIYVNFDNHEVYLVGYYNAFRYCPGGIHVAYRNGSRDPHEGTADYISLDVHNGTGPTRRSDLESLGYCMLKWLCGSLPWSEETNPSSIMKHKMSFKTDVPGLLKQCFKRKKISDVAKLYLEKVMILNYEEKPDYQEIRKNISSTLQKVNVEPYDSLKL